MIGECPHCKCRFEIQPEWIGQEAQCPECQRMIVISELSEAPEVHKPKLRLKRDEPVQSEQVDPSIKRGKKASSEEGELLETLGLQENNDHLPASLGERMAAFFLDRWVIFLLEFGIGIVLIICEVLFYFLCGGKSLCRFLFGGWQGEKLFLVFLFPWWYQGFFINKDSATPGKKWMHLVVARKSREPTFWDGVLRAIARELSNLTLGLGYLVALTNRNHRTLHDLICKTYVYREKRPKKRWMMLVVNAMACCELLVAVSLGGWLWQAVDMQKSMKCKNNLSEIWSAMQHYQSEYGCLPEKSGIDGIRMLYEEEILDEASTSICPDHPAAKNWYEEITMWYEKNDPDEASTSTCPGQPSASSSQGSFSRESCSYIYLGPYQHNLRNYSDYPLVVERSNYHSSRFNVLFADGHVEVIRMLESQSYEEKIRELIDRAEVEKLEASRMMRVFLFNL